MATLGLPQMQDLIIAARLASVGGINDMFWFAYVDPVKEKLAAPPLASQLFPSMVRASPKIFIAR
jgi:hypothetical protein